MDFKVHSMVGLCLKNIKNSNFFKIKYIIMKVLVFILTVAASLQVSASAFSQMINISVKNLSFENVLNQIEKQSGYKVFYDLEHLKAAHPVTVNLKNSPLEKTLEECFKNQPFTYQIVSKTIIIKSHKTPVAKNVTVTGKVTDDKGIEMPGVMVKVKNATVGTVTNANGVYSISVPEDKTTVLIFSFLGYLTQEIQTNGRTVINLKMTEDLKKLSEIVVIGYGSVQRSDLTGAVASVNMADLAKAPVTSFDEALAGRIAGVTVSSGDGQPGSTNNIVIRGPGSITQDNSPLYVVDGFPLEDSDNSSINPSDIESIDVLKDASATAIYGSRGANGVIMITTKKGKKGDPVITFNSYYGIQKNTNRVETLSPYEFVKLQLELGNGAAGTKSPAEIYTPGDLDPSNTNYNPNGNTLESYKTVKGLYLEDQYFRTAAVQNYDLSIRGGTDKTLYSISGNYRNMDGIVINSGLKRYQGRITLDQTVNKKLKVGTNINYSRNENFGSIHNGASENPSLYQMYSVWGYRPVTGTEELNLDEELFDDDAMSGDDYRFNPIISVKNEIRRTASNMLTANGYAEYGFNKYLKLRVTGGLTTRFGSTENFNNSKTVQGNMLINPSRGVNGSVYNNSATNLLNENTLSYNRTFNKDHRLNAVAGYTMQTNKTNRTGFSAVLVPNEALQIDGLDEAIKNFGNVGSSSWGLLSYLGRVNYSFKGKYLVTGSFRADGSSKFLKENRWGYFPSGAVAWVASKEDFFIKQNVLTNLKFRASYGLTGNNRIGDFDYLTQITLPLASYYSYNNSVPVQGASINTIGNALLKWETTKQTDLGVDMGFLKDRITLEFDYYRKVTDDLLLNADLPRTTGVNTAFKNVGKMSNEGLEFSLNSININSRNFKWSSGFNISFNKNKVLGLAEGQNALARTVNFNASYSALYSYISILGQPIGQMYGLLFDGVYQPDDFNVDGTGKYVLRDNIPTNGNNRSVIQPGHIKYKDLDDDGQITTNDYTIIGRGLPIHTGGFTNNFSYKNFDLNVLFQWSYGNDLINANRFLFEGGGRRNLNQFASFADRWTFDNQDSDIPRAGGQGPAHFSNRVIEDGSYIRLKTVALGYNVPETFIKEIGIKNLRLYASAQNLFTWTNYSGADPEVSVGYSTLTQGFDYSAYPRAKTITFGLNLSF
jgi:TonB-linked SusC/RagA family outer membrane protein